jgi:hypothetical protein
MATATALATENISPIAPPNSGPKLREIIKYAPPIIQNKINSPIAIL